MSHRHGVKPVYRRIGDKKGQPLSQQHIEVPIRPPNLFLGALVVGCILELIMPLGPGLAGGGTRAILIGLGLAAIGIAIAWKAIVQFADAGTSVQLDEPTDALVTGGLYSWSRNPIYIGLSVCYTGLSIALTSPWTLLLLPVVLLILSRTVIVKEEAFLASEFGEAYGAYKARVPRWL